MIKNFVMLDREDNSQSLYFTFERENTITCRDYLYSDVLFNLYRSIKQVLLS